jgi:ketosteroid isomerase-like protein
MLTRRTVNGRKEMKGLLILAMMFAILPITIAEPAMHPSDDESILAALDTEYQAAVAKNDAVTMDRILADDFVLVTGNGSTQTKADLLKEAREKIAIYERQEDSKRTVRIWGDTAVVTALLWAKGSQQGKPFEYKLWFSDTYVRTPTGWRYVFAQASLPLPKETK